MDGPGSTKDVLIGAIEKLKANQEPEILEGVRLLVEEHCSLRQRARLWLERNKS